MIDFELNIDVDSLLLKENVDNSFREVFDIQNFSVDIDKNKMEGLDDIFEQQFVPNEDISFNVILDSKAIVHNSEFREYFNIHNFEICLDESKSISDILFEENFKQEQKFDYNIIDKLKKNLNSRKILTREEREQIPELEPEISTIDQENKETVSIEENLQKSKSVIKENTFYKIVEFDASELVTQVPTQIDTSYKEEVDQKILDLENKYEDLLKKTKDDYESRLEKMMGDFSNFRNQINQQVTRMSFISSATGGGAVNILDMDDVDKSNLQDEHSLSYNSSTKKFELVNLVSKTLNLFKCQVFTITQTDLDNGYIELAYDANPDYYELSELFINGLHNNCLIDYNFLSPTQVDISNLLLGVNDIVKINYIKS